jgi:hypothetical protein
MAGWAMDVEDGYWIWMEDGRRHTYVEDERVRSMEGDGGRTAKFAIVVKVYFDSRWIR